jgi:CHASE1-domain containing sensor protein
MSSPGTVAITGAKDISADSASTPKASINDKFVAQSLQGGMGWAWVMLAVSLLLSVAAFYLVKSSSQQTVQSQFEFRETEISESIQQRMAAYTQALQGGAGPVQGL